jgi:cation transport regulator ChaC
MTSFEPHNYVLGFGSLMLPESAARTVGDDIVSDSARAVRLKGFVRTWGVRGPSFTALASHPHPDGSINGILFRLKDNEALRKLDIREMRYIRTLVPWEKVELYACHSHLDRPWESQPRAKCWIYVYDSDPVMPSEEAPIAHSYMDVCISGCLRISSMFAEEFVRETWSWTHRIPSLRRQESEWDDEEPAATSGSIEAPIKLAWLDDRSAPRYVRYESPPVIDHSAIDAIIEQALSEHPSTLRVTIEEVQRTEREARRAITAELGGKMREIAELRGTVVLDVTNGVGDGDDSDEGGLE